MEAVFYPTNFKNNRFYLRYKVNLVNYITLKQSFYYFYCYEFRNNNSNSKKEAQCNSC